MENITQHKLVKDQEVYFINERLPMKVKAFDERYVILTRLIDKKEDSSLIKNSGYSSFDQVKDFPIYTIIDFHQMIKGPNDYVFNLYDYNTQEDIDQCLIDLQNGECLLSKRHSIDLQINWDKTLNSK